MDAHLGSARAVLLGARRFLEEGLVEEGARAWKGAELAEVKGEGLEEEKGRGGEILLRSPPAAKEAFPPVLKDAPDWRGEELDAARRRWAIL